MTLSPIRILAPSVIMLVYEVMAASNYLGGHILHEI